MPPERLRLHLLLVLGVLFGTVAGANANPYYVRTSGNDGNSGLSPASAWRTVEHAGDTLVAGETVYVGAGTYTDRVDVQNSGTAANPIVFVADLTGVFTGDAGAVVIDDGGDVFDIDNEDHIHVIGFRVTGGGTGFRIRENVGIRIESCRSDGHDEGFEIDDAEVTITDCQVDNNDHEGIRIRDDSTVVMTEMRIHDNNEEGIRVERVTSLTVRRCDIHGNGKEGVRLNQGTNEFVNCVVYDNTEEGFHIDSGSTVASFWHMTVADNGKEGIRVHDGNATVTNSIIAFNTDAGLRNQDNLSHSYNLVFGNGPNYEGTSAGTGEISVDPAFVGGTDYHLQVGSPATDAGTDGSSATSVDRDSNARPSGAGWDMGAYELPADPHFAIAHDGTADGCTSEPITITKHDPLHGTNTGYTGTISITTSTGNGDFSLNTGAGTLTNLGGGSATYTYAPADAGVVVLGFVDGNPEVVNFDVSDGSESEESSEDPDLTVTTTLTNTFRDDFGSVSYTNDDGTLSWSGPWIELDPAGAGPGAGNIQVTGGELYLEDWVNTGVDVGAEREANLAGATSATFSFDYRTTTGVDASDAIFVHVSPDGGSNWTLLERITGITGTTSGSRSYDITAWATATTRVRISVDGLNGTGGTVCCYGASNEQFLVDNLQIEIPSAATCGPDHFAISHDGSAVHCQAENVTIAAHDAGDAVDTGYTGIITVSTSSGNGLWSIVTGGGSLTNLGGGSATYAFDPGDLGQVVLGLENTFAETVNLGVADGAAVESPLEDPDLTFSAAGFSFLADGVGSAIGTQIGGKPSDVAPGAQSLELQAIRTSDQTGACEAALQGATDIEMGFTCEDPPFCFGVQVEVNGTPISLNPAVGPITYSTVSLDFGGAGDSTAPIVIRYDDVGRIQLHARTVLSPSNEEMLGSSNPFVVTPFAFDVSVAGNPGATGPTGPIFGAAGSDFGVDVRAVLWQAADDADGDGRADGHDTLDPLDDAVLTDNGVARNFGRETASEALVLGSDLFEPLPGNDPGLSNETTIGSFTAGAGATTNTRWDEVGVLEVTAGIDDGDYLGIGAAATANLLGRTGPVGRFLPQRFDVSVDMPPILQTICATGNFSYVGESFVYSQPPELRVVARSVLGTQTLNYEGVWDKLSNATLTGRSYSAFPAAPALDLLGLPPTTSDPFVPPAANGVTTLTFGLGSGLRFDRADPVAPFDAEVALAINVIDGDGVAYASNPFTVGAASPGNGMNWSAGKEQRYGRIVLENAFGSELSPLAQPLRAEYWTVTGWLLNSDDSCTALPSLNITQTAVNPPGLVTTVVPRPATLANGDANLVWTAPGQDGSIDVLVDLSPTGADLTHLRWDWTNDGAGPFDDDPTATVTFGVFNGPTPVIFRREVY